MWTFIILATCICTFNAFYMSLITYQYDVFDGPSAIPQHSQWVVPVGNRLAYQLSYVLRGCSFPREMNTLQDTYLRWIDAAGTFLLWEWPFVWFILWYEGFPVSVWWAGPLIYLGLAFCMWYSYLVGQRMGQTLTSSPWWLLVFVPMQFRPVSWGLSMLGVPLFATIGNRGWMLLVYQLEICASVYLLWSCSLWYFIIEDLYYQAGIGVGLSKQTCVRSSSRSSIFRQVNIQFLYRTASFRAKTLDDSSKSFSALIEKFISKLNGRAFRNGGRYLIGFVLRTLSVSDRLSRSRCALVTLFCRVCAKRFRNEGMKGLVLFLKCSYVLIQQGTAGYKVKDLSPLKRRVRRSGAFPSWIPPIQRSLLRQGDVVAIRFWTSLVSIYRILEYPSITNVGSIVNPGCTWVETLGTEGAAELDGVISTLWARLGLKKFQDMFKDKEIRLFPISKSSPLTADLPVSTGKHKFINFKFVESLRATISTAPRVLAYSAFLLMNIYPHILEAMAIYLRGSRDMAEFLGALRRTSRFTGPNVPIPKSIDLSGTGLTDEHSSGHYPPLGKLGLKVEAAGKIRVFAMVDAWTQWLFNPLHKVLQDVLRCILEDATFDQIGRVEEKLALMISRGYRVEKAYSFDLSSATDRLPVSLQVRLLGPLIGAEKAEAWAKILIGRDYSLPKRAQLETGYSTVRYAVGQPMGALSSWVMLAMVHHLIVQWAAFKAGKMWLHWFDEYVVLGDDIVIFSPAVAREYLKIMTMLGVEVGLAKSLVSRRDYTFEFAKKLWVKKRRAFVVPFRDCIVSMLSTETMLEFMDKHQYTLISYLRLRGLGFKTRSKWNANLWTMSARLRLYVVYFLSSEDFMSWISHKSIFVHYPVTRNILVKMCELLFADLEALILRLKRTRSSIGNPDVWSDDFMSIYEKHYAPFDLYRYPISGIQELFIKTHEFRKWLDGIQRQVVAEEIVTRPSLLEFVDVLSLVKKTYQLILSIEYEADKLSNLSLFTTLRKEERTFTGLMPLYKRWVRYNGLFGKQEVKHEEREPVPKSGVELATQHPSLAEILHPGSYAAPFQKGWEFLWEPWSQGGTLVNGFFTQNYTMDKSLGWYIQEFFFVPINRILDILIGAYRVVGTIILIDLYLLGNSVEESLSNLFEEDFSTEPFEKSAWSGMILASVIGFSSVILCWIIYSWVTSPEIIDLIDIADRFREIQEWERNANQVAGALSLPDVPIVTRSPQIGHGWSEPWSFNPDWPEAWR